jgi:hypothetical protein
MCGLCGLLGSDAHWTDAGSFADPAGRARVRLAERQARVAYLNRMLRVFGCTVSDWQGTAYLLSTLTGKTEIVDNLASLWAALERLSGHRPDPLADKLLERVAQAPDA